MADDEGSSTGAVVRPLTTPAVSDGDIFDREEFDAVELVNKLFPNEASLSSLDDLVNGLKRKIRKVDRDILEAVRQQSSSESRARQELGTVRAQIDELFVRINDIQRKAIDSETMVQEICRDIKKLDFAKQHLTHAITALRRLAMLTKAIQTLEEMLTNRDSYKECAHLLEAVTQLTEYFEQYGHISKVAELTGKLETIRVALKGCVFDDFHTLLGMVDSRPTREILERLTNGCLVINALGPAVVDQLIGVICDKEIKTYTQIYGTHGEVAKLERTERRYNWLKKRLDDRPEEWAIFPSSWRMAQVVCMAFCQTTKSHLAQILDQDTDLRSNVAGLLKAVVDTNRFEQEMVARFAGTSIDEESTEDEAAYENTAATEARKRLTEKLRAARRDFTKEAAAAEEEKEQNSAIQAAKLAFEGSISCIFEKHLKYYVEEELQEMMSFLASCLREEYENRWEPTEDSHVLQSANKLFLRIQSSLKRCARFISKGEPLYLLARAFQSVLGSYSSELMKRLPKTAVGTTTLPSSFASNADWQIKLSIEDELVVCNIAHTASYCATTARTLERAIQRDIKEIYTDQIQFEQEEEAFNTVAAQCLSVLVLGVNTRLDASFQEMVKIRWDSIETTGDECAYVSIVRNVLRDGGPRLAQNLTDVDFDYFCDKMVHAFVPRFHENLFKLKRISFKGALQLAIDAEAVKSCLMQFPQISRPDDARPPLHSYTQYVDKEMNAAISLMKVCQSNPDTVVENYLLLMPQSMQNTTQFQRIVELMNIKKVTQTELLSKYHARLLRRSASISDGSGMDAPVLTPGAAGGAERGTFNAMMAGFTMKRNRTVQETAAKTRDSFARMSTSVSNLFPGRFQGSSSHEAPSGRRDDRKSSCPAVYRRTTLSKKGYEAIRRLHPIDRRRTQRSIGRRLTYVDYDLVELRMRFSQLTLDFEEFRNRPRTSRRNQPMARDGEN